MFSDWTVFRNWCTKTGIRVKGAYRQLVDAFGVGDVGLITNVLLIQQLKTDLISVGKLA